MACRPDAFAGCQKLGLVKQYEYDERVELSLDGSAVVDINASVPALVALRGATLDVDPEARFDRQAFRRLYEAPGVTVRDVSAYRRHGRRFVHVRLEVSDIAELPRLAPLSWSRYRLDRLEQEFRFVQEVGPAAHACRLAMSAGPARSSSRSECICPAGSGFTTRRSGSSAETFSSGSRRFATGCRRRPCAWRRGWRPSRFFIGRCGSSAEHLLSAMAVLAFIIWWVSRKGRSVVPA